ncbi:LysM peptidoglycan-binding domain-containing protein [Enterococcus sp. BWB1-3]|uniref:glucosaminidase domain-containing protein n=1 Tax=Enterococcus sp. BWB1-3 TaxID=2787713 RepID=UPI001921C882|nr:glucosaminidase domain-containing protein [Enterococcus sp. BWB1-3]MBL1228831.1 LysM peptidoglycan-binding domain-containing protein [Enterococcus sp. BWB1-3]
MKRKKSLKRMCLASAGLLTASATSTFTNSTIISAQNKTEDSVLESTEQQDEILFTTEVSTEYENFEESSTSEAAPEMPESSTTESIVDVPIETEESSEESIVEESSTEESSTTESSSTEASESESEETSSTTESSTTDSTTEESTSSSSTNESSETTTSSSKPDTSTSTSKPNKPSKPSVSTNNNRPSTSTNNPSTIGPAQSIPVYNQTTTGTDSGISTSVYYIPRNLTTQAFIDEISEDAREIAGKNNLYASVMIAQAILESGSGNSALASAPNYNLFGIKGSYEGESVNFLTQEDTGGGNMISIRASFRKYPSYKESLTDYMKLLNGGVNSNSGFYSGTWKSNTKEYKDATKFLTGRYATDTSYASKLNSLIEAYDLTEFDKLNTETETLASLNNKVTQKDSKTDLKKEDKEMEEKLDILYHVVKKGDSLKSISELYNIPVSAILERNQFERRMIFVGQKLVIPTTEVKEEKTVVKQEKIVDRSIRSVQRVINSMQGEQANAKSYKMTASKKKSSSVYEVRSGDTLAKISKKTGISVISLKEWNSLDQYFLTEGQELVLTPPYATSI